MNLVNTLCFVGANSSWEEVQSSCTLMEDPKRNVPFNVGKITFIKLFAFAFILAIFAISLLEFRPALISFRVQPTCAPFITGKTSLTLQFNKNTITYKYSAKILRHHYLSSCLLLLSSVRLQIYFCSRMWTCIFCVTRCTVGMHNAMARIGLETNSLGDVSLGKEKAPLLQ